MPWSYRIIPAKNVIFTEGSGVLTEEDLAVGSAKAHQDPRFHPDLRGLFDYTLVTEWKVSNDTLSAMASKRKFSAKSRTAILVKGALSYGMIRAYKAYVERGEVMVFTEREEALAWLDKGVPAEKRITPVRSDDRSLIGSKPRMLPNLAMSGAQGEALIRWADNEAHGVRNGTEPYKTECRIRFLAGFDLMRKVFSDDEEVI